MLELKVTTVGNSAALILPKEALKMLNVEKGDKLFLMESPDGVTLSAYDPCLKRQIEAAEEAMSKFKGALHELAK